MYWGLHLLSFCILVLSHLSSLSRHHFPPYLWPLYLLLQLLLTCSLVASNIGPQAFHFSNTVPSIVIRIVRYQPIRLVKPGTQNKLQSRLVLVQTVWNGYVEKNWGRSLKTKCPDLHSLLPIVLPCLFSDHAIILERSDFFDAPTTSHWLMRNRRGLMVQEKRWKMEIKRKKER